MQNYAIAQHPSAHCGSRSAAEHPACRGTPTDYQYIAERSGASWSEAEGRVSAVPRPGCTTTAHAGSHTLRSWDLRPALGRFISADTIVPDPGSAMGYDRYAYVKNSPLMYTDPSGHKYCVNGQCEDQDYDNTPGLPSKPSSSTLLQQPNSNSQVSNGLDLINSNPYYLAYWPWLLFPKNEPCLGKLGCWGGIDYAHEMVRTNGPYFDKIIQGYLTDLALLTGFSGSASAPGLYNTGGQEVIVILEDGTLATYNYGGQGGSVGEVSNASAYGGVAVNVRSPEDYRGISSSMGFTASLGEKGVTASYFWNGDYAPFTPGIVQGIQVGYAPGAGLSVWWSDVVYNLNWSGR